MKVEMGIAMDADGYGERWYGGKSRLDSEIKGERQKPQQVASATSSTGA